MSKTFLYCERSHFPFFEDYIKSFIGKIKLELVLVDNLNSETYNSSDIYFFISKIPQSALTSNIKAIYMNMEQLTRTSLLDYAQTLKSKGIPIVDYNEINQKILKDSQLLRYQYLPEEIENTNQEKIYDVAFVGTPSLRRKIILDQLKQAGVNVSIINGWGKQRDQGILKAKVLLNIHYDNEYNVYESLRCDRFIFNGMIVVSENSFLDDTLDIKDLFISSPYHHLVSTVLKVIDNYPEYLSNFQSIKETQLLSIIKEREQDLNSIFELISTIQVPFDSFN